MKTILYLLVGAALLVATSSVQAQIDPWSGDNAPRIINYRSNLKTGKTKVTFSEKPTVDPNRGQNNTNQTPIIIPQQQPQQQIVLVPTTTAQTYTTPVYVNQQSGGGNGFWSGFATGTILTGGLRLISPWGYYGNYGYGTGWGNSYSSWNNGWGW